VDRCRLRFRAFLLGVSLATAQSAPEKDLDVAGIAKRSAGGVALIEVRDARGETVAVGSGFVVDPSGLVVSSLHVFEGAASAAIKFEGRAAFNDPRVVGFDADRDLIVLSVGASTPVSLPMNRDGIVEIGERIIAIGNPVGLSRTVSDGIISSVRESESGTLYQITAPLSPGSSGGPVLNRKGQVIGVSAFTMRSGQNLNFAGPIQYVFPLLRQPQSLPLAELRFAKSAFAKADSAVHPAVTSSGQYRRGLDLYEQGRLREAIEAFKTAIELEPGQAEPYFQIGSILANELASRDQATVYLQEGLKISPEDSVAHSLLAVLYRQDRRYNDSIAESRKAIALSPLNPAFHFVLGMTFAESQRSDEAIAELRQAITLRPSYALAHYHVAMLYERVGSREAAYRTWQAFLNLEKTVSVTEEQVRTAKAHLEALRSRP
jgi:tetratricopeptide (TPR) repeat protein